MPLIGCGYSDNGASRYFTVSLLCPNRTLRSSGVAGRPRLDRFLPALEVRKVVDVLLLPLRTDPWIRRDIGDGVFPDDELAVGELLVEHRIQSPGLAHVAVDGVRNLLRRVEAEVMVLAGHGSEVGHLPEQPLDAIEAVARGERNEASDLVGEIEQYRARLEHRDRRTAV